MRQRRDIFDGLDGQAGGLQGGDGGLAAGTGPLTRTSISLRPNLLARSAQVSAARWAAKGVLLRLPLKPTVPADAKHSASPLVSVMVTMVLLKVALMWAIPRLTLRRALRFLLLATNSTPRKSVKEKPRMERGGNTHKDKPVLSLCVFPPRSIRG